MKRKTRIHKIDCTPTFKWAASIYIRVLSTNKIGSEGHSNAVEGILEMAATIDRINKKGLLKETTTQDDLTKD